MWLELVVVMLKVMIGIGIGVLMWSNPEARRVTAMVLRGTADYFDQSPADQSLPFAKRVPPSNFLND